MRNKLFLLVGMLIASICFVSCSDNENNVIYDYQTYNATFTVTKAADNTDLLADSVFLSKTYVIYKDQKYPVIKFGDKDFLYQDNVIQSRYNMPNPLALRLFETKDRQLVLGFGEFGPVEDYRNETFTIYWADGTKNTVNFNLYVNKDHTVEKESMLDGQKGDFFTFDIKK